MNAAAARACRAALLSMPRLYFGLEDVDAAVEDRWIEDGRCPAQHREL